MPFVNGRFVNGAQPIQTFLEAIEDELQRARGAAPAAPAAAR